MNSNQEMGELALKLGLQSAGLRCPVFFGLLHRQHDSQLLPGILLDGEGA